MPLRSSSYQFGLFITALAAAGLPLRAQTTGSTTATAGAAARKPNVIMIYTDDLGYGDISSFAGKPLQVKTPNIDRFATEGTKFTRFYVSMPICSPSRASVMSGMHAPETGLTTFLQTRKGNAQADQNDYLDPALAFLPKTFKAAGYATAHVGKWHLGGGRDVNNAPSISKYGYDQFWSTWESPQPDPKLGAKASWDKSKPASQLDRSKTTAYMVDLTLDFLKRHNSEPCFITLWPEDVHSPFNPSDEMLKKHGGAADKDESLENFLGVLEEYDRQVGRLLEGIKAQGAEQNTIVFFSGDNGPNPDYKGLRTDGLRGKKATLYEGGIREPFIIRWPGHVPAGKQDTTTMMSTIDLLPTLAALTGIGIVPEAAGKYDGEDMSKAVLGTPQKRQKPLMYEFGRIRPAVARNPGRSPQLAIQDGDFKLLVNRDGSDTELYNLAADPTETTNIADQNTSIVQKLSKAVLDWSKTLPHRTHPAPAQ
jgi:arylsulfatase A-like enzyme